MVTALDGIYQATPRQRPERLGPEPAFPLRAQAKIPKDRALGKGEIEEPGEARESSHASSRPCPPLLRHGANDPRDPLEFAVAPVCE